MIGMSDRRMGKEGSFRNGSSPEASFIEGEKTELGGVHKHKPARNFQRGLGENVSMRKNNVRRLSNIGKDLLCHDGTWGSRRRGCQVPSREGDLQPKKQISSVRTLRVLGKKKELRKERKSTADQKANMKGSENLLWKKKNCKAGTYIKKASRREEAHQEATASSGARKKIQQLEKIRKPHETEEGETSKVIPLDITSWESPREIGSSQGTLARRPGKGSQGETITSKEGKRNLGEQKGVLIRAFYGGAWKLIQIQREEG